MNIEIGMYVRTKHGYICKIVNINDFREPSMKYGVEASYLKDIMFIGDEDIIKASHNILDLIEIGDYVNGKRVDYILEEKLIFYEKTDCGEDMFYIELPIKNIVTKEQFENMKYKID